MQLWWVLCLFLFIKKWICRLYVSNTFISWPHLYSWPLLWPWLPDLLPNFWPEEIPTLTPKVISWCILCKNFKFLWKVLSRIFIVDFKIFVFNYFSGNTGNFIVDFFNGREFNPNILGLDLKLQTFRFSMIGLAAINVW